MQSSHRTPLSRCTVSLFQKHCRLRGERSHYPALPSVFAILYFSILFSASFLFFGSRSLVFRWGLIKIGSPSDLHLGPTADLCVRRSIAEPGSTRQPQFCGVRPARVRN